MRSAAVGYFRLPDERRPDARRLVAALRGRSESEAVLCPDHNHAESVTLPRELFSLLLDALELLASGNPVALVPMKAELTTQQAADILNVSRPFVVELLESGAIPFRKVGTHRRVRFEDLMAYRERDDAERRRVADELSAEGQDLDLDY